MTQLFNIHGKNGDIIICLGREAEQNIEDADSAMVISKYHNSLVLTYHPKRNGWEFPKGKRQKDEDIMACAVRETFEETGGIIETINSIGYFTVDGKDIVHKTAIFTANIERFEPKPRWSETDLVKLFEELPENLSFKDDVYKIVLDYLKPAQSRET